MKRNIALVVVLMLVFSACDSPTGIESDASLSTSPSILELRSTADMSAATSFTNVSGALALTLLDGQTVTAEPVSRHIVSARRLPSNFASTIEALGGTVVFAHSETGLMLVDGLSDDGAGDLLAVRGIDAVVADLEFTREPNANDQAPVDGSLASPADAFAYTGGYQWNMDAVGAPVAWAAGRTGSADVTVAIIDSGLDPAHLDLSGRIDHGRSVSFLPAGEFDYLIRDVNFPGYPDWLDLNGHGSHVGSTVASNGIVAAGVTDQVTLMAIKVCRYNSSCSGGAIIAGVLYAADNGADVANMSLGGSFDKSDAASGGFPGFVGFLNRTFNYAKRKGMTIVVSAGNSAEDLDANGDEYKTYCDTPGTICVSATGPQASDDVRFGPWYDITGPASYTNFGRSAIDLAAPGGDFDPSNGGGFVWAACSSTQVVQVGNQLFTTACTFNSGFFQGLAGTSMASPHVTGLAALLVEDYGRNPRRIQNRMQQTADDLGQRGTDKFYGKGYINIPAALGIDATPLP